MANNKIVGNETLATYHSDIKKLFALKDGYYENMAVGLANNLISSKGLDKTEYFNFQASAGFSDIDSGFANMKSLKGNSVVLNQLIQNGNFATTDGWVLKRFNDTTFSVENNVGTLEINSAPNAFGIFTTEMEFVNKHTYLFLMTMKASAKETINIETLEQEQETLPLTWEEFGYIETVSEPDTTNLLVTNIGFSLSSPKALPLTIEMKNFMCIDLTLMFGAGKEPTSAYEFVRMFPNTYYEYNTGELMSCKSSKYKYTGLNQYNVLKPNDYIKISIYSDYICNGTFTSFELYDSDKNLISTTTEWYIETPLNCTYIKVVDGNSSTCLYVENGDTNLFEDYVSKEYALPNIELRSVGNVYDEIKPNGTYIKRIGSRAYQEGDENDTSVITDKTNTYYVLANEVIEQKPSYQFTELTKIDANGTQEFDSVVPQGVNFLYQTNLKDFVYYVYDRANGDAYNLALKSDLPILYRHTITMTIGSRTCCFTVYHSSNLIVDSIQDLTTLLHGTNIGVLYRHSNNNYYNKLVVGSLITNCYFVSDDTSVGNLQLSSLTITLKDEVTAINFQAK